MTQATHKAKLRKDQEELDAINDGFIPAKKRKKYGRVSTAWKVFYDGRWRRVYCRRFRFVNPDLLYFCVGNLELALTNSPPEPIAPAE